MNSKEKIILNKLNKLNLNKDNLERNDFEEILFMHPELLNIINSKIKTYNIDIKLFDEKDLMNIYCKYYLIQELFPGNNYDLDKATNAYMKYDKIDTEKIDKKWCEMYKNEHTKTQFFIDFFNNSYSFINNDDMVYLKNKYNNENTFLKNGISIIKEIDYIKDIKNKKIYDESINIINNTKDEKLILYFEYENYRWNYFISNEYKDVYYGKTCFDYNILIELIKHIKTFNDIEIDNNDCYLENDKYQIIIKNNTYKNNEIIKEMITIEKTTLIKKIMKIKNIIPISSGILCGIFIVIFVFFIL